jgi:uncharacterized protein
VNTVKRLLTVLLLAIGWSALAAETIPPAPAKYFNDYANVVSSGTSQQLNEGLAQFERDTSSQIVVAVFAKMQSDSSIEDYTVRVAHAWRVGQKGKDNGAVLFVFVQDRKMFLQVGYGLEGALPDALCKRIIEDEIKPHFKAGDYNAGLTAGVNAILAATKGEYKGNGRTYANGRGNSPHDESSPSIGFVFLIIVIIIAFFLLSRLPRLFGGDTYYTSSGWSNNSGWGGWSSGGGGDSGGGFSGGGGDFGGGGAGGSW